MLYPAELPGRDETTSKISEACQDLPQIARSAATNRPQAHFVCQGPLSGTLFTFLSVEH
jgi:hypothetical protein